MIYQIMQSHELAHKIMKSINMWQQSIIESSKTLKKLKQYIDLDKMHQQILQIMQKISQKQNCYNILEVKQTINTIYLLMTKVQFRALQQKFSYDQFKVCTQNLDNFIENIKTTGISQKQLNILEKFYFKLTLLIERQTISDPSNTKISFQMLEKILQKLFIQEKIIKDLLKYTAMLENESQISSGPLMESFFNVKILICRCFTYIGELKQYMRKSGDQQVETNNILQDLSGDLNYQEDKRPDFLTKYLAVLSFKIEQANMPVPTRLDYFEKSIAILTSLYSKMNQSSYLYVLAKVETLRAKRLLASSKKQLTDVWKDQDNLSKEEELDNLHNQQDEEDQILQALCVDYRLDSLNDAMDFMNSEQIQKIDNILLNRHAFYVTAQFSKQLLENFGQIHNETAFEYLSKFQHFNNMEHFLKIIKKCSNSDHKPQLLQRLYKNVLNRFNKQNEKVQSQLEKNFDVWKNIVQQQQFKEIISDKLPTQSAHLIIQYDTNKNYIYLALMIKTKNGSTKCFCKRQELKFTDIQKLVSIQKRIELIKQNLVKTPLISQKELEQLENEQETEYTQLLQEFEEQCQFITEFADPIINQPMQEEQKIVQQEIAKDPKAKGAPAKTEGNRYETSLPKSKGNIEILTCLVDHQLQSLPFENLNVFKDIPAKSKDFSLQILANRYQKVNYNQASNSSNGLIKDKVKYISYDFTDKNLNASNLIAQQKFNQIKFDGTSSDQRIASIGEWDKYISENSMILFYSHPSILDIISPAYLTNLIEVNKARTFIIMDKINPLKQVIKQSSPLDMDSETIPLSEQGEMQYVLMTLMGSSSMVFTQWSIEPNQQIQILSKMLKNLDENHYISTSLYDYQNTSDEENKKKYLYTHNMIFYGVPVIRLS